MSEDVSSHSSKAGKRWLHVVARILVAVLMVITLLVFLLNVVALVGIWTVYAPARNAVTDVASTMTRSLTVVDNGLTRVNTQVQNARQTVTKVNDAAVNLGDRVQANSPLANTITAKRIEVGPEDGECLIDHSSAGIE